MQATWAQYAEMAAAERHHEVPYSTFLDGQPRNGLIDLLHRPAPEAEGTIAELKTERQVADYVQAITQRMGISPLVLLVFLTWGRRCGW